MKAGVAKIKRCKIRSVCDGKLEVKRLLIALFIALPCFMQAALNVTPLCETFAMSQQLK